MSLVREGLISQKVLPQFEDLPEVRYMETGIVVGSTPSGVIEGVLNLRPEILGVNFMVFDEEHTLRDPLANNKKKNDLLYMKRDKVSEAVLFGAINALKHLPDEWGEDRSSWALAVTSLAIVEGEMTWRHIPMMDFACEVRDENLENVQQIVLPYATQGGCVLETQNGYHFYSYDLYDQAAWEVFLNNFEKSKLVNPEYLNFCRSQGLSCLRIDSGKLYTDTPRVVRVIEPFPSIS